MMRRLLELFICAALAWCIFPASASAAPETDSTVFIARTKEGVPGRGGGSGFHIGNGEIVTAAHVVKDTATLTVTLTDGREFPASIVRVGNGNEDWAVIRIKNASGVPAAKLACRDSVVGEPVELVGNPFSFRFVHTWGRIASTNQRGEVLIDATVAPGMSGGPALDASGNVIGIISANLATFGPMNTKTVYALGIIVPAKVVCEGIGRK